ncbi:MAG TPA: matrixin family metalloprotease [Candidatus Eisenbacteria bacterium]|nr:matrixin family metalloprotease [Candidatus Eisenbacteria bacterium]
MTAVRLLRSAALTIALTLAADAVRAQTTTDCDNPGTIKWCPPDTAVTLNFNPSLDPMLENAGYGDAVSRGQCFQKAVNDWNAALVTVGARLRLVYAAGNLWAADQNGVVCADPDIGPPLQGVYSNADLDGHRTDGRQTASTGHNSNGKLDAGGVNVLGPGWLVAVAGPGVSDTSMQVVPADGVLAILQADTQGLYPDCLREADITWFTHAAVAGGGGCARIRWDYRLAGAPAMSRFDFYSVMLHEIGHLLGLAHQNDDGSGKNVMQSTIPKGQRYQIGPKELTCLCMLYGTPGKDCALVTGARHSTWGAVKTLYR